MVVGLGTAGLAAPRAEPTAEAAGVGRRAYSDRENKRPGDGARRLAVTQQQLWDREMRAVSGSICDGC